MAMCYRRLGQHKSAAQALNAALKIEPRRPDLLFQLGLTLQISGAYRAVLQSVGVACSASKIAETSGEHFVLKRTLALIA